MLNQQHFIQVFICFNKSLKLILEASVIWSVRLDGTTYSVLNAFTNEKRENGFTLKSSQDIIAVLKLLKKSNDPIKTFYLKVELNGGQPGSSVAWQHSQVKSSF